MTAFPAPRHPADRERTHRDAPGRDGTMGLLDHLDELRRRIVYALLSILVGFLGALFFIDDIFTYLMRPLRDVLPGGKLIFTEPTEAFMLQLKLAALVGFVLAMPVILTQVWLFVAPGLYRHEKRFAIPFVFFATAFFVLGALFSHYVVFPWSWAFFASFSTDYMEFLPRVGPAFSLYVRLLLAFGVVFQLPTIVFLLARMGLVTAAFMLRHFKYAVLIAFIAAAILTPSPDAVTQTLMAGPIMVLYLFSVGVAWVSQKRTPPAP